MDKSEILSKCDHTLLSQSATWDDIKILCDDAMHYHTASICIPPFYVKKAKEYVKDEMKICTVIGFPNGYNKTSAKCFEAKEALLDGADEIDMVINIGLLKDKKYDEVKNEIIELKKVCGDKILKVIIETCLLTDDEKKIMCKIVSEAGADFIKTSTGFSKAGATFADVKLFSENVSKNVKIKAAGGISTLDDAVKFIEIGASRLGTSKVVKIIKEEEKNVK